MAKSKFDGLMKVRGQERDRDGTAIRRVVEPTPATGAGKRSNEAYRQVSAYIRKDTHRRVKIALLEEEREFSDLVEELLSGWVDSRT